MPRENLTTFGFLSSPDMPSSAAPFCGALKTIREFLFGILDGLGALKIIAKEGRFQGIAREIRISQT